MPALLYHHAGPRRPGALPSLTVSTETFERQVRWLARRGYTGICPSDWLAWPREGQPVPPKPVLFTFDDGYGDTAEYALPVLRRFGFGGVVFAITSMLGAKSPWDDGQLMSAEQIRYWDARGIQFGTHSREVAAATERVLARRRRAIVAGHQRCTASRSPALRDRGSDPLHKRMRNCYHHILRDSAGIQLTSSRQHGRKSRTLPEEVDNS